MIHIPVYPPPLIPQETIMDFKLEILDVEGIKGGLRVTVQITITVMGEVIQFTQAKVYKC